MGGWCCFCSSRVGTEERGQPLPKSPVHARPRATSPASGSCWVVGTAGGCSWARAPRGRVGSAQPQPLQFRPGGQHPREGKREGHDVLPALRSWTQTMASRSWSLCGDSSSCRRLASLRAQVEGDLHLCQDGVPPSLVPGSGPSLYLGVGVLCPASLCPLPIPRSKQVCQGSGL